MRKAIAASKKKNDKVHARNIADLLGCDRLPECYMTPQPGGAAGDADEEPHGWLVDGNRDAL
jgi:hypothetical protein